MLFSQLRLNSPIYILHKDATPFVEVGQVTNVTAPMPNISAIPTIGQPMLYTVDVTVNVGGQSVQYQKMPSNNEVADFASNGNIFISCTREGVNTEVQAMRQRSADVLSSVTYHKNMVEVCDKMIAQLNPEMAEKAQQQQEIASLREQINSLTGLIQELRAEKASSEKTNKKIKDNGNDNTDN